MSKINLLSPKQVINRMSIPSSTLYRWISNGTFPKPIKIGPRRTAFRQADIEQWLDRQSGNKANTVVEGHAEH